MVALAVGALPAASASAEGTLVPDQDAFDFGYVTPGSSSAQSFAISNSGPDAVTIGDVALVGDVDPYDFGAGTCGVGLELASGESCTVSVAFTAPLADTADYEALLFVEGAEDDTPAVTYLIASGEPVTGGLLIGAQFKRGKTVYMEAGRTQGIGPVARLEVKSNSSEAAFAGPVAITGPFRVESNDCGAVIAPNRTCVIAVRFEPPAVEPRRAREPRTTAYQGSLTVGSGPRGASLTLSGTQWHPPEPDIDPAPQLDRLTRSVMRVVRGGPSRELALPVFDVEVRGTLRLWLWAKVGRRQVPIARASTTLGDVGKRLRFRLWRKGRVLLSGSEPVVVKAKMSFTSAPPRKTHSKVRSTTVKPAVERAPKPKRKRR